MPLALRNRMQAMTRTELVAGLGAALIFSGLALRFAGPSLILPPLTLLRSMSDETITLAIRAFSLLEILVGIALLVWVAVHIRKRTRTLADSNNEASQQ